jgi:hypothetical protein
MVVRDEGAYLGAAVVRANELQKRDHGIVQKTCLLNVFKIYSIQVVWIIGYGFVLWALICRREDSFAICLCVFVAATTECH